jgi:hypothetical protein
MRGVGWGLGSFFKIGLIALVFIIFAKWIASKVNVPGLSAAVAGA